MHLIRLAVMIACVLRITGAQTFEVASVKASPPGGSTRFIGGPGTADPERIAYENVTLKRLLMKAYGLEIDQISGPGFIDSDKFSIAAKVPTGTTPEQLQGMLQNLLIERFQLTLHHDPKELPIYELTIAKGGPKLTPAASADPNYVSPERSSEPVAASMVLDKEGCPVVQRGVSSGSGRFGPGISCSRFNNTSIPGLVTTLENFISMEDGTFGTGAVHVIDKTELAGEYDITLKFHLMPRFPGQVSTPGQATDPDGVDGPTIFTALEQQLGLKLTKTKATLDRIVIDHAERVPVDN